MTEGWVKLYRKITDDVLWQRSNAAQKVVMISLLVMASHKDHTWEWQGEKYTVQPGQMITSLQSIAKIGGKDVSIQSVRSALLKFEKLGFLTNQSTKTGRLITIVNWAKYQSPEENQQSNQQTPNKEPTTIKNDKNDKKEIPSSNTLESRFDELWKLYPKKQGKQSALKAYKKAVKDGATDDQIKTGIEAYVKYLTKEQTDPQYIKQGSSFFNQRSWEDDWSGGGVNPEPQESKPLDKAAALLHEIEDEMSLHPTVSRQEAAEITARMFTENGRTTTADKILKFLDKYERKKGGNEQ